MPRYMDGKVLTDALSGEVEIQYGPDSDRGAATSGKRQQLSATEEALVREHLSALGYLG